MKMRKSFTLIELLIVITIIGILAVALVPRISSGPARARDVQRKADLQQLATAMELYYADNGEYPNQDTLMPENDCIGSGGWIDTALETYLSVPDDPGSGSALGCDGQYHYHVMSYNAGGTTYSSYAIFAKMEINTIDSTAAGYYCSADEEVALSIDDLSELQSYMALTAQQCPKDYAYYVLSH